MSRIDAAAPGEVSAAESTITLTWAENVENHVGHEQIGAKIHHGPGVQDLLLTRDAIQAWLAERGLPPVEIELVDLGEVCPEAEAEAAVLVIRGLRAHSAASADAMRALSWDKHVYSKYTRTVVNKVARWNLCFTDHAQEPDLENKKGRTYSFDSLPRFVGMLRSMFTECLRIDGAPLEGIPIYAEGNHYYERKSHIGWHGDLERSIVAGYRIGDGCPLHFWWFEPGHGHAHPYYVDGHPIGRTIELKDGDAYIMSHKAVGGDFKKNIFHLRHAAGDMETLNRTQKHKTLPK